MDLILVLATLIGWIIGLIAIYFGYRELKRKRIEEDHH